MEWKKPIKPRQEIINLTLLLLFSFITALLIAFSLIAYYGPTGKYTSQNVVLAPDVLQELYYKDKRSGSPFKILFDKIVFTFFDKKSHKIVSKNIGLDAYTKMYALIKEDESMDDAPFIHSLFEKRGASITLYTKPEKIILGEEGSYPLQQIEFAEEGNHYRVELIGESENPWAYFTHEGILDTIEKELIP